MTLDFLLRKPQRKKIILKPPMLFTLVLNSYNEYRPGGIVIVIILILIASSTTNNRVGMYNFIL